MPCARPRPRKCLSAAMRRRCLKIAAVMVTSWWRLQQSDDRKPARRLNSQRTAAGSVAAAAEQRAVPAAEQRAVPAARHGRVLTGDHRPCLLGVAQPLAPAMVAGGSLANERRRSKGGNEGRRPQNCIEQWFCCWVSVLASFSPWANPTRMGCSFCSCTVQHLPATKQRRASPTAKECEASA